MVPVPSSSRWRRRSIPLLDEVRIAAGGDALWLLHDAALLRFPIRTPSGGKRLVAWSEPESFPLPEPLRTTRKQNRRIVTAAASHVAVIDLPTRESWYFARGEWSAAPPLPDEPFSAAILAGGNLVISTPEHSTAAFAAVDRKGNVASVRRTFRGAGVQPGPPLNVSLIPGGRAFTVVVASGHRPCAFELRDAAGAPVALAADAVAGPVPLAASESFFTYLEPGVYRATVRFCDGRSETQDLILPVELGPMPVITFGARPTSG